MTKYLEKDLESVLKFGQNNPNSTLEDWFEYNSKHITKNELESFDGITYDKFIIKDVEYFIFNYKTADHQNNFINKFVGNKEYIELINLPGEYYENIFTIITFDRIDLSIWDDYEGYKGVKTISDDTNTVKFTYNLFEDFDEDDIEIILDKWGYHEDYLENNNIALWDNCSILRAYIDKSSIDKLNFKPIKELFKVV